MRIVSVELVLDKKYSWKTWKTLKTIKIYKGFTLPKIVCKNLEICSNTTNITSITPSYILKNISRFCIAFTKRKSICSTKDWKQSLTLMSLKTLTLTTRSIKIYRSTIRETQNRTQRLFISWISSKQISPILITLLNPKLFSNWMITLTKCLPSLILLQYWLLKNRIVATISIKIQLFSKRKKPLVHILLRWKTQSQKNLRNNLSTIQIL